MSWQAFELRPGTPPGGIPRPVKPGEGNELSPGVKQLADAIGLKMKRPDFIANSRPALEAAEYAREKGKFEEFHLAVFRAYWEDNRNIGLREVLRDIAEKFGLDGGELENALSEGRYAAVVAKQDAEARTLGVTGIPAYIIGNQFFIEGAQPYDVFQRAMHQLRKAG